jgi:hypothetical protein
VCDFPDQTTLANDAFLQDFFGLNLAVVLPPSTSSSESSSSKQCVSQEPEGDSALNLSLADVLADEEAPFVGNVLLRQSHSMDPVDGEADLQLNENETFDENPCSSTVIRRLSASTPLADVTSSGQLGVNQGVSRRSRHNLSSIYLSSLGSVGTRAHVVDVSDFGVSPILGGVGASVDAMPHDGNPLDVSLSRKAVARRKLELVLALAHAPVQEPANSSPSRLPPASDVPPTDPAIGIPANACEGIDRGPVLSSTCHMQGPPSDWLAACGIPPSLEYCDDPDSHDNVPSTMSAARSATTDANTHVVEDEIAGRDSDENPGVTPVVPDDVSIAFVEDAFVSKRQQQGNEADELRGAIPLPVSAVVLTPSNSGVHCTEPSPRDDVFSGVEAFGGKRRPVDRRKTRKGRNPHKACVGCVVS